MNKNCIIKVKEKGVFVDKSNKISDYKINNNFVEIQYKGNSKSYSYKRVNVIIEELESAADDTDINDVYEYLKIVADNISLGNITSQFDNIKNYNPKSVLASYFNKATIKTDNNVRYERLFPFQFNLSQRDAVEKVLKHNISVIEGPPGTGKTQTILNLIANLAIAHNKKIAIVSSNNSAVKNVEEKLQKCGYDFLLAPLGSVDNRKSFFENQGFVPLENLKMDKELVHNARKKIRDIDSKINDKLENERKLAMLKQSLAEYELQRKYFLSYCKNKEIKALKKSILKKRNSKDIISFMCEEIFREELFTRLCYH